MAIYNISGQPLSSTYDSYGTSLNNAYDIYDNLVFSKGTPIPDDPYIEGRTLLFEDSFDGESLNAENWSCEIGNVRNSEMQFYRAQNVSVEDNNLVLTAKRETHLNKEWTSGSITGQLKKSWLYGRFEAKIKFPSTERGYTPSGCFAAFWTLGANHWIEYNGDDDSTQANGRSEGSTRWPQCGEIDIVETLSIYPPANLWSYTGNSLGSGGPQTHPNMNNYHIYAMEWTSDYIAMSLDGLEFKRWTFADYDAEVIQAYHLPQFIILNLAVGATSGRPSDTTTEMKMYVDWVRVYAPLSTE